MRSSAGTGGTGPPRSRISFSGTLICVFEIACHTLSRWPPTMRIFGNSVDGDEDVSGPEMMRLSRRIRIESDRQGLLPRAVMACWQLDRHAVQHAPLGGRRRRTRTNHGWKHCLGPLLFDAMMRTKPTPPGGPSIGGSAQRPRAQNEPTAARMVVDRWIDTTTDRANEPTGPAERCRNGANEPTKSLTRRRKSRERSHAYRGRRDCDNRRDRRGPRRQIEDANLRNEATIIPNKGILAIGRIASM
jgi:hypothetical protein